MNAKRLSLAALMMASMCTLAMAQPGPGNGPRGGLRFDKGNTPGWSMMTPAERNQHRDKMMSFKTVDECKAYLDQHHAEMTARAKEQGKTLPMPRNNACERMKARGMLK